MYEWVVQLDSWVIAYIRVVPVEEQPVDSLQLVFPERIAVFIFSGTLGFLPVTGGRSLLFQIKQFPLVVSVQPQERGSLPSLAQHSKAKIKRGLEECQLLPRASALAHVPSLSRTLQSSLGRCQLLTPTCCPRRVRSTTLPGTKLQAAGTHINNSFPKEGLIKVIHVLKDRWFENDWSRWMRETIIPLHFHRCFQTHPELCPPPHNLGWRAHHPSVNKSVIDWLVGALQNGGFTAAWAATTMSL